MDAFPNGIPTKPPKGRKRPSLDRRLSDLEEQEMSLEAARLKAVADYAKVLRSDNVRQMQKVVSPAKLCL